MEVQMFLASLTLVAVLGAAQAYDCYECSVSGEAKCAAPIDPLDPPATTYCGSPNFCLTTGTGAAIERGCDSSCTAGAVCCQTDLCNTGPQPTTIEPITTAATTAAATTAAAAAADTTTAGATSLTCYSCNSASDERCFEDPAAVPTAVCPGANDYCTTTVDGGAIIRGCNPICPARFTCCQTNLCNSKTGSGSAAIAPHVTGPLVLSLVVLTKTLLT